MRDSTTVIDLTDLMRRGENEVEIRGEGGSEMACQVVRRYALPWALVPKEPGPLAFEIGYDRTKLAQEEVTQARARLR